MLVGWNLKLCIGVFKGLEAPIFSVSGEGGTFLFTSKLEELLLRDVDIVELTDRPDDASLAARTLKFLRESIQLTDNDWD